MGTSGLYHACWLIADVTNTTHLTTLVVGVAAFMLKSWLHHRQVAGKDKIIAQLTTLKQVLGQIGPDTDPRVQWSAVQNLTKNWPHGEPVAKSPAPEQRPVSDPLSAGGIRVNANL